MLHNVHSELSFGYKFVVCVLLLFINMHLTIEHDHFYFDNNYRTENQNSLESCLGRFDVHGNTIIRTGESQAIGGKFLQGLELETPEKCQRLCCETSDCDVYVFEEKNDGYCYLFQCGSPKNFHCKFTRHSNYTSALLTQLKSVLKTTPRPNNNVLSTNISTQEKELISLKAKPENYLISSTTQAKTQLGNENELMEGVPVESRNLSCGRFEFPCHSGECIAVYNACNGIPQCVDGSDEGPGCLDPTNNKVNNNYHDKPETDQDSSTYKHSFKILDKTSLAETPTLENRHPINLKETKKEQLDVSKAIDTTSFTSHNNGKVQNVLNLEQTSEKVVPNQEEINLPKIYTAFPTPQTVEEKAHSFNENSKSQSRQRQSYHIITQEPQYSISNQPTDNFGKKHKHVVTVNEKNIDVGSRPLNPDSPNKPRLQSNTDFGETNFEYADYSEKTIENAKKDMPLKKNEASRSSISVKKEPHPAFVEQYKVMEQHLEIKFTDHDGHSDKPRGAVLSLTLGFMVTGVLVMLIGCRLRKVARRGSRHAGKVPYAPDEDFLVNGMYL